eukprot:scaffold87167_cov56-Attheya_sp.AAC.5
MMYQCGGTSKGPGQYMRDACDVAWAQQKEERQRAQQLIQQNQHSRLNSRQEVMERAKALEAQMIQNVTLGTTGKKKKKKRSKQKRYWHIIIQIVFFLTRSNTF